ncbi:MAG TPA: DUF2125 domain-containing protein [Methylomirabilota bacterium]|jgi:hypothetical protein|nr:DUF2125 domain-containing protein [Methylomirabilota bacterium]
MRRMALVAAATAALAAFVVMGSWFLAARQLQADIAGWTERQRAEGVLFSPGEIAIGGFPFRLDVTVPNPSLASADGRRRWEGPAIHATAPLWRRGRLDYEASGRHRYRFTRADGASREILLDLFQARGRVALDQGGIRMAGLSADKARITGTAPGQIVAEALAAELLLSPEHAADLKEDSASFALSTRSIAFLGEGAPRASALPVQSLEVRIALTGPLPWGTTPGALTRWRDAGGTLELRRLELGWSGLTVEGDGTLALDEYMRPEGAVALRLAGLHPTLQKLTAEGVLAPEEADLIARRAGELSSPDLGDPGRLLIAVSAQDGRLTVRERTYRILQPVSAP